MQETLIQIGSEFILKLALLAIAAIFGWLEIKISKNQHLANINAAKGELKEAAEQTAGELQQTFVERWKAETEEGKLTEEQIAKLGADSVALTIEKLSEPAIKVLKAAGVDLTVYIKGVIEAWLEKRKNFSISVEDVKLGHD